MEVGWVGAVFEHDMLDVIIFRLFWIIIHKGVGTIEVGEEVEHQKD